MAARALYTPEVLALATGLAAWPWDEGIALRGAARSPSCGSSLTLGLELDERGRIARVALRPQACAIGQAAAALFAAGAVGRNASDVQGASRGLQDWLQGRGPIPDWPGLDAIEPATHYPGRHGAILLAWRAASELLSPLK